MIRTRACGVYMATPVMSRACLAVFGGYSLFFIAHRDQRRTLLQDNHQEGKGWFEHVDPLASDLGLY